MVIKALESGETLADNWKTYRQALRDITKHSNWPALKVGGPAGPGVETEEGAESESDWPVKPS
jgi:hypothetical protein